jgi:triosephosphate isomerase
MSRSGRSGRPKRHARAGAEAHGHIRQRLRQWFGGEAADQCHVIYGGSVKPTTFAIWPRSPTSTVRSSAAPA